VDNLDRLFVHKIAFNCDVTSINDEMFAIVRCDAEIRVRKELKMKTALTLQE
jgi:hypothetical protein